MPVDLLRQNSFGFIDGSAIRVAQIGNRFERVGLSGVQCQGRQRPITIELLIRSQKDRTTHQRKPAAIDAFADELAHARQWLFQGELFRLHCLACGTYRADPPRASAQIWEAGETAVRGKTFAAALFRTFPNISAVALEGATGRGWVIRLDDVWYANDKTKDELADLWGIA